MNVINNLTKTQKAAKNVIFSTGGYFLQLILSLVVRIYFVKYIGREYLGLNSVYASILSMLSIADLGLDTVFVYLLYKPLKEYNYSVIKGVLNLYKIVYRYIALFILIVGVSLIPFLPKIIGHSSSLTGVYSIYFLYLINAIVGYLNAYNRSLLIADQNGYVVNGLTSGFIVIVDTVQIFQIIFFPNPIIYMIIQVIGTILTNVIITYVVNRRYSRVVHHSAAKLDSNMRRTLIHNGVGGISNKIGSIIVISSDNVLLSIFTNLVTVGMYSNYTVLTSACSKVMQTISSAITPSLGQMGVERDVGKNKDIFLELTFIIQSISLFVFAGFLNFVAPFVRLWLGTQNVFPMFLTWLISFNLWLTLIRTPAWMFTDSFGLQWIQKWKAVIEAVVNLGISLLFLIVFKLGIEGIILGTILSTISVVLWYEPWIVFKCVIPEMNLRKYFAFCLPFLILIFGITSINMLMIFSFKLRFDGVYAFVFSTIEFLGLIIVYCLVFFKNKYFKNMLARIYMILRR